MPSGAQRGPPRGRACGRAARALPLAAAVALLAGPAAATAAPVASWADACVHAIAAIGPASGIPGDLLAAIGRVESGRRDAQDGRVKAWPWTVNAEGRGALYATKSEAISAVAALQGRGVASIDVGCMQVNLMHHPAAFTTLEDAFDPVSNVRYAAAFLRELHAETGDWTLAAAYYHSRTPERMLPYQQKVLAQLPGALPLQTRQARRDPMQAAWAATMPTATMPAGAPGGAGFTSAWTPSPARPVLRRRIPATRRWAAR